MSGKSIVVAGAGGNIGSFATGMLARIPEIRRMVLIDRDIYEPRNVANQDIGLGDAHKPKVQVQAHRLAEIRPGLEIVPIHAPLETLQLGAWRADLIVACLDSKAARQAVNERAWRLGVPWIDSGVLGSQSLARVNVYAPAGDAPCLECAWSQKDYDLIEQEYPCGNGVASTAPNSAPSELGALAAAMLTVECRKILAGDIDGALIGKQATVSARWHQSTVTMFRRNPFCRFDHATWRIEPLRCDTREMQIEHLLQMAGMVRIPGRRFIRRLVCPVCGSAKSLFCLDGFLDYAARQCGACGGSMAATGFDIIETLGEENLAPDMRGRSLEEIGFRYGDVIQSIDGFLEIATV